MFYLRPLQLPGMGRILHSNPMASFPVYVPPKLRSSATTDGIFGCQHNTKHTKSEARTSEAFKGELTRDASPLVADVVSVGLPQVLVLGAVEGVKGHRGARGQILHRHPEGLVHQGPRGDDGEDWGDGQGHGGGGSEPTSKKQHGDEGPWFLGSMNKRWKTDSSKDQRE
ncbi:uncharacterized protein ACO6RY_11855 [Pungitius sinensis]